MSFLGEPRSRNRAKIALLVMALAWLAAGSEDVGAEGKPGARISVEKSGGQVFEGVLVAVKAGSLLMADSSSSQPVEMGLDEIIRIRIKRKAKLLEGLAWGGLAGAVTGGSIGYFTYPNWFQGSATFVGASIGVLGGALLGYLFALDSRSDRVIEWAAISRIDRDKALVKLRKISRFPNEYADKDAVPFR